MTTRLLPVHLRRHVAELHGVVELKMPDPEDIRAGASCRISLRPPRPIACCLWAVLEGAEKG